jgi:hypothetical protein
MFILTLGRFAGPYCIRVKKIFWIWRIDLSLDELTADGDGRLDRVRVHRLRRLVQAHRVVQLQVLHVLKKSYSNIVKAAV